MARKIVWGKKAKAIFDEIIEYLEYEFSEETAIQFVKKVSQRLTVISKYPEAGRASSKRKNVRFQKIDKFRNLYYVIKKDIIIVFIFDTRQNPNKNPY